MTHDYSADVTHAIESMMPELIEAAEGLLEAQDAAYAVSGADRSARQAAISRRDALSETLALMLGNIGAPETILLKNGLIIESRSKNVAKHASEEKLRELGIQRSQLEALINTDALSDEVFQLAIDELGIIMHERVIIKRSGTKPA